MISSVQYGEVRGVDKPISRLVQGTVMIGLGEAERSFELLDEVRDLGCTAFDTAHHYGTGDSERTFGRWMEDRGPREDLVVIGKGAHHDQDRARVTPFDITADLFDSVARLRTTLTCTCCTATTLLFPSDRASRPSTSTSTPDASTLSAPRTGPRNESARHKNTRETEASSRSPSAAPT